MLNKKKQHEVTATLNCGGGGGGGKGGGRGGEWGDRKYGRKTTHHTIVFGQDCLQYQSL